MSGKKDSLGSRVGPQTEHSLNELCEKETSLSWEQLLASLSVVLGVGAADLSASPAALEKPFLCQNKSCPEEYWYNNGLCPPPTLWAASRSAPAPQPSPAGNNFTPTVHQG